MCGITGICNFNSKNLSIVKKMNFIQAHRGPDSEGYYYDKINKVCLGMTRLAIIGLTSGNQPQYSQNKNIVLVFNGEIYNYKELGLFYFNKRYTSDSKLIVDLYQKLGIAFLSKLNGMFSIAIYDKLKKKVFLVRDRFGIKPLYYLYANKTLYFSSELKTLHNSINFNFKINEQVAWNYFSLGYCNTSQSIYDDIKKVDSGTYLEFNVKNNKIKKNKWWNLNLKEINLKNKSEYYELILDKFVNAIKYWSISDVPICFMVSGGLDSSLISYFYSKLHKKKVNTCSLGFKDKIFDKWNELSSVSKLTKKIKSNHFNIFLNNDKFLEEFNNIVDNLDEPFGGGLPSWYFFKNVSKKYKVVISGVGGDELFGNYNRPFNFLDKCKVLNRVNFNKIYSAQNFTCNEIWKKRFLALNNSKMENTSDFFFRKLRENLKEMNLIKGLSFLDLQTQLQDDFLYLTDRFSMSHSLEVRTPFLDHELVEAVFSLPENIRISKNNYKPILKNFSKKYLPKIYHNYPKKGFSLPLSIFMRNKLKPDLIRVLSKKNLKKNDVIDKSFYDEYVEPMLNGNNQNIQLIWNVFMFQCWLEKNS